MGFSCGIVGLPNVGKSTLFNALTNSAQAAAANYPFTTIEPNAGRIPVPDARLDAVAAAAGSAAVVPTRLEFVDIAGLVAGASRGEGLGNQFLGHVRTVDAILHVVRCFDDDDVSHVAQSLDAGRDMEVVSTELMLADLEVLERRLETVERKARGGDKEAAQEVEATAGVRAALEAGRPARAAADVDPAWAAGLGLLSAKPVLYVLNVDEAAAAEGNAHAAAATARAADEGAPAVMISAAIEAEVARLDDAEERRQFLASMGLAESGLARVVVAGYALLGLITFFTANRKQAQAWTVPQGATAWQAAAVVHSDFQKGFIRAETVAYDDFIDSGGEAGARDAGRLRQEGRDYAVCDGDVILFRFNV